jgi:hypothetical protein
MPDEKGLCKWWGSMPCDLLSNPIPVHFRLQCFLGCKRWRNILEPGDICGWKRGASVSSLFWCGWPCAWVFYNVACDSARRLAYWRCLGNGVLPYLPSSLPQLMCLPNIVITFNPITTLLYTMSSRRESEFARLEQLLREADERAEQERRRVEDE